MINVTPTPPVDVVAACRRGIVHAARALGDLVGMRQREVTDDISSLTTWDTVARFADGESMVVIGFTIDGGMPGHLVAFLPQTTASQIAERLVRGGQCDINNLDEAFLGALSETGNIVASAFLNGTAESIGQACWPSVPEVQVARDTADLPAILARFGLSTKTRGSYLLRADLKGGIDLRIAVVVAPALN